MSVLYNPLVDLLAEGVSWLVANMPLQAHWEYIEISLEEIPPPPSTPTQAPKTTLLTWCGIVFGLTRSHLMSVFCFISQVAGCCAGLRCDHAAVRRNRSSIGAMHHPGSVLPSSPALLLPRRATGTLCHPATSVIRPHVLFFFEPTPSTTRHNVRPVAAFCDCRSVGKQATQAEDKKKEEAGAAGEAPTSPGGKRRREAAGKGGGAASAAAPGEEEEEEEEAP